MHHHQPKSKFNVNTISLVSWCFKPSQPQRITSGLIVGNEKALWVVRLRQKMFSAMPKCFRKKKNTDVIKWPLVKCSSVSPRPFHWLRLRFVRAGHKMSRFPDGFHWFLAALVCACRNASKRAKTLFHPFLHISEADLEGHYSPFWERDHK